MNSFVNQQADRGFGYNKKTKGGWNEDDRDHFDNNIFLYEGLQYGSEEPVVKIQHFSWSMVRKIHKLFMKVENFMIKIVFKDRRKIRLDDKYCYHGL